jgi:protein gp37
MGENTKIEWAHHTFNPWYGCQKVGPGCDHCYAEGWAKRSGLVQWGPGAERRRSSPANWRKPLAWNAEAERLGVRYRVFCASLADVFDNQVPVQWRQDLFDLILATPHLDWLLVTKRIGNAKKMLNEVAVTRGALLTANDEYRPPANLWLGVTVCNQAEADRDAPKLLATPAAVRFLSMEPLLGPVDLRRVRRDDVKLIDALGSAKGRGAFGTVQLDWIIVGGESGPGARPMYLEWVRSLRDQCAAAGVPFLFKQWGEWAPYDRGRTDGASLEMYGSMDAPLQHVGKKLAGRMLDGELHEGFPI